MISTFALILSVLGSGGVTPRPNVALIDSRIEFMASFKVSTASELKNAISAAKSGDKIILASGNYGAVSISGKNFTSQVTIVSADLAKMAHIDSLLIKGTNNIKIQGIDLGRPLHEGEGGSFAMATVSKSSNVIFEGMRVHGSADNNPSNDGRGISVLDSSFVKVLNSSFSDLGRGILMGRSTDIQVVGNSLSKLRSDGMDFAEVKRVLVDSNKISDIYPKAGDHPDAIQFFTSGAASASTDIVIRNNEIFQGKGGGAQGIFLRNADGLLPFERVKIQNNVVYAYEGFNGISVIGGKNIEVVGNTSISQTSDRHNYWFRLENIVGGKFENNVGDSLVNVNNSGLAISGNKLISENPKLAAQIRGINDLASASAERLSIAGFGFQHSGPAGAPSAPAALVKKPTAANPVAPALSPIFDLQTIQPLASSRIASGPVGMVNTSVPAPASQPKPMFTPAAFAAPQSAPSMSENYGGVQSFLPSTLGKSAIPPGSAPKQSAIAPNSAGSIQFSAHGNATANFAGFYF